MAYMVTFESNAGPIYIPAPTAKAALEAGEDAEAGGAENVIVQKLGDDEKLPLGQFAVRYCGRSKRFGGDA